MNYHRDSFTKWFLANAGTLERDTPEKAAEAIQAQLALLDERLSVEVAEEEGVRDLVLSASGEASLFQVVEQIGREIRGAPGWQVYALKPPRGFEFTLDVGGVKLRANDLHFEPMQSPSMPGELGVRLLAPVELVDALQEHAWLLVQTGIGERAASLIRHLEVRQRPSDCGKLLCLTDLGKYIDWYLSRKLASSDSNYC